MSALAHGLQKVSARLMSALGVGVARVVNDTGGAQTMQVQIGWLETLDNQEVAYHWGYTACPPLGARVVMAFVGGDRNRGMVIGSNDPNTRPTNLQPGESMIYDAAGNHVYLKAGGTIEIKAATGVHLVTPSLAVDGPITSKGDITAGSGGSDQVTLQTLRVAGVQTGGGSSGEPVPGS